MRIINITHSQAFKEGIGKHYRACGLMIIAFSVRTVKYLIPHPRLLVSPLRKNLEKIVQLVYESLTSGMLLREIVQHLHKGYGIPSVRTSPRMFGETCFRIAPEHRTGLVPCMAEEAGILVQSVLSTGYELMDDICKQRILLLLRGISLCIFGIERECHIETVEPHLMRIDLLVPELP